MNITGILQKSYVDAYLILERALSILFNSYSVSQKLLLTFWICSDVKTKEFEP